MIGYIKEQYPGLPVILGGGLLTSWMHNPAWKSPFAGLVDHLIDRLSGEDGKAKKFKEGTIKNLEDFLDSFTVRDITDDTDMSKLVEKARKVLGGTDADTLRKDPDFRQRVMTGFSDLKTTLDGLLIDRPSRKITFEEE